MSQGMRLELGTSVRCTDGAFGELADVVVDPKTRRVTHLVVRPRRPTGATHLVPVGLAEPAGDREICLTCTVEEAQGLESVQEFAYLRLGHVPVEDPDWDVGVEEVLATPYLGNADIGGYVAPYDENLGVSYDRIPKGEAEIRRASDVISSDGRAVGHVDGFVVDADEQITHVVLVRGHLWRKRCVAIPIDAVDMVETDSVTLRLTTKEIGKLPAAG